MARRRDGLSAADPVAANAAGQSLPVGFTGTYADGAPVYRMPTISVSASRATETARIEEDDRRSRRTRAGSAG